MTNRKGPINVSIPVHGDTINSGSTIKILGVNVDSKLSFNEHIKSLCTGGNGGYLAQIHTKFLVNSQFTIALLGFAQIHIKK